MRHGDTKPGAVTDVRWTGARGRRRRMARAALLSLLGLWGSLGWGRGIGIALPIDYFALGDSVASGYGLADDETTCRQSMFAYPWQLYARLQETFVVQQFDLLACSGTTTETLERQVSEVLSRLSPHPTLLTLTVGANDFGWSDVFAFAQHLCILDDSVFHAWIEGIARPLEDRLVGQLVRVLAYPQVEVILTDYYNPTNVSGAFWKGVHPQCVFVDVYDRSEEVARALNAAITQASQRVRSPAIVQVATVHDAFHGHEAPRPWCGTAPPDVGETWIQYPTDPDSNATPVGGDCFHVNRAGAEQYAETVIGLVSPDLGLPLRLRVNDTILAPGETLTLTVTALPPSTPLVVDLYIALQLPDQRVGFLQSDGRITSETLPYLQQWPVSAARAEVFHYTFTGAEPTGTYVWLAAFLDPGTGMLVGSVVQAPFTVNP
jgi:lysophospholipase L1-like esterase